MSIEQSDTIDFVNIDKTSGNVLLTISDHLDWDESEDQHLVLLQSKLNAYLRFIEGGELHQKFPETSERAIIIQVVGKFPMSKQAGIFFETVRAAIDGTGLKLQFRLLRPELRNSGDSAPN
jgi:hypothetical protein